MWPGPRGIGSTSPVHMTRSRSSLAATPSPARGTCAAPCIVGGETLLVGEKRLPADVGGMMVVDDHGPLRPGSLDRARFDGPIRVDDALGMVAPEHVGTSVRGIGEQRHDPIVG